MVIDNTLNPVKQMYVYEGINVKMYGYICLKINGHNLLNVKSFYFEYYHKQVSRTSILLRCQTFSAALKCPVCGKNDSLVIADD